MTTSSTPSRPATTTRLRESSKSTRAMENLDFVSKFNEAACFHRCAASGGRGPRRGNVRAECHGRRRPCGGRCGVEDALARGCGGHAVGRIRSTHRNQRAAASNSTGGTGLGPPGHQRGVPMASGPGGTSHFGDRRRPGHPRIGFEPRTRTPDRTRALEAAPLSPQGPISWNFPIRWRSNLRRSRLRPGFAPRRSRGEGDARRWLVNKNGSEWTDGHYALVIDRDRPGAYLNIGGGREYVFALWSDGVRLQTNTWQHLAMTYDGAILRLWVDGKPAGELQVGRPRFRATAVWRWGAVRTATFIFAEVSTKFGCGTGLWNQKRCRLMPPTRKPRSGPASWHVGSSTTSARFSVSLWRGRSCARRCTVPGHPGDAPATPGRGTLQSIGKFWSEPSGCGTPSLLLRPRHRPSRCP